MSYVVGQPVLFFVNVIYHDGNMKALKLNTLNPNPMPFSIIMRHIFLSESEKPNRTGGLKLIIFLDQCQIAMFVQIEILNSSMCHL